MPGLQIYHTAWRRWDAAVAALPHFVSLEEGRYRMSGIKGTWVDFQGQMQGTDLHYDQGIRIRYKKL